MLPSPDTAVNTHVEETEIPLQLHSQGKRSPFLPLTSMPDLPQNNFSWAKTLSALTVQARDQEARRNIRKGVFPGSWLWHLLQQPEKGEKKGELHLCSLFMIQINTGAGLLSPEQV